MIYEMVYRSKNLLVIIQLHFITVYVLEVLFVVVQEKRRDKEEQELGTSIPLIQSSFIWMNNN
jgi:hypothetical protein